MLEIEGIVERIVFRNEENGYTVAVILSANKEITAVGKFLNINIGQPLKLSGCFKNSKYGEQFEVQSYENIVPKTEAGIERYLSSGLIKGVGPLTAKAIVDMFGKNTLEIIEFNPTQLLLVKGISKKKMAMISNSFLDVKEMQNAMVFLQTYNISSNLAIKIYEYYKSLTVELVKQNPYRLVEDITGIGFLSADRIAMNMGIEKNSLFRIRAGILHLLSEASEKGGHTYQFKIKINNMLCDLLKLTEEEITLLIDNVYDILQKENVIRIFWKDNKEIICLSKNYHIEHSIAAKLALLKNSAVSMNINLNNEIKEYEKETQISLHKDQIDAISLAVNSGVSVITGGPGTGKTTIISCALKIFKMLNLKTILLAPTGRAAKRLSETTGIDAKTIHRALEINFRQEKNVFVYNENNPLPFNVVIVDEVSMVDVNLMYYLLRAIPKGCKLILVGDKDQLPSVGAGNVLADILSSKIIEVAQLTKIYRQNNNSLIVSNAHLINSGEMPVIDNKSKDFFFEQKDSSNETFNSVIELATKRIPDYYKIDSNKIQILAPLKSGICGIQNLNEQLQSKLNPFSNSKIELMVGSSILREGDRIMQTTNNYNLEWEKPNENDYLVEKGKGVFNGDIGMITKINNQTGEVEVVFEDKKTVLYPLSELNQISLAYAITIHKSQGSEFDIVIIPIISGPSLILTRNLIYTGVTRAKKMVVLVGDKFALQKMIKNNHTNKRYTLLSDFLVEENSKMEKLFGEKNE